MAEPLALHQALQHIGFTQATTKTIVNEHGIDSCAKLRFLKDKELENLCKVVRHPGSANQGNPPVPNLGHPVSFVAKNNLKLTTYWLCHQIWVSCSGMPETITLAGIRSIRHLCDHEEAYNGDKGKLPMINDKD